MRPPLGNSSLPLYTPPAGEEPWLDPVSTAEALWYTGFIFRAFEQGPEGTFEVVFVPTELRSGLAASPHAAATMISLDRSSDPAGMQAAGDELLDDACSLLAYLQSEDVRPATEGDRQ